MLDSGFVGLPQPTNNKTSPVRAANSIFFIFFYLFKEITSWNNPNGSELPIQVKN